MLDQDLKNLLQISESETISCQVGQNSRIWEVQYILFKLKEHSSLVLLISLPEYFSNYTFL